MRVEARLGEVRKVQWVGRSKAPDRVAMFSPLDAPCINGEFERTVWVELKNPDTIKTFPKNAHERAQAREHERMRTCGQVVLVLGTKEQIDEVFL
jgi:hypothetical protein